MRRTTLATLVCGTALALSSHAAPTVRVGELPACRSALGSGELPTCRLSTDYGYLDESVAHWTSHDRKGRDVKEWLPAQADDVPKDSQSRVTVRAYVPQGTVFLDKQVTYTVQVDASPFGDNSQLRARLWLADDQGLHVTPLREWKSKPFGGNGIDTFTIEAEGGNTGFHPSFLYVELGAVRDVRSADGLTQGSDLQVENVHVGMRPTAAR